MAAQKGKDLLLKLDETGTASFITVAGLRARTLAFNAEAVDVTDSESANRWRELLAGAGVKRASLAGSGIFKDQASDEKMRELFFDGLIRDWQIIIPDFGTVEGPFQIVGLEFSGNHNDEIRFEVSMESAGALSFAAQ